MHCPFCSEHDTKVVDSRLVTDGGQVRRRRECSSCAERFTTYEVPELVLPSVIKQDGRRKPFDEECLKAGMLKALEKRPVSVELMIDAIARIKRELLKAGEREVSSNRIGELVMSELKKLDQVAYVRFASVYRRFRDVSDFNEEISKLNSSSSELVTDEL